MTTFQVLKTSVTNNSLSKDYPHPNDHAKQIKHDNDTTLLDQVGLDRMSIYKKNENTHSMRNFCYSFLENSVRLWMESQLEDNSSTNVG